ncbi:MAG: 4-(cytidine 5'-diphospho)-2-C-methyl-D-erythritol kinase [Chitinophagaceae bacterium]|jgi:4-diphosphocytidyl-2-C-methyl-D-erythritol kinase|nr:4-(cytidine 5'-diphospho)-2-C-methyl-D-erythritol kinase [Chitinophagaceae bacterium]
MLVFPNGKINLGLRVVKKREDGFHNIETVFFPVSVEDALEVIVNNAPQNEVAFSASGIAVAGSEENNLCIKAYHLLKKKFPQLPGIKLHLHKAIPTGAGLGGGSADGAFTLKLINEKFSLGISEKQLINYALLLGSDCPFFIVNKPCIATGRGEILKEIQLNLSGYYLLIINPGIHVNTGWAFSKITPCQPTESLEQIIQTPVETWKENLLNDFEKPVFAQYPEIENIKKTLYQNNALYASMTGTGSTVFGIFKESPSPTLFSEKYFCKMLELFY